MVKMLGGGYKPGDRRLGDECRDARDWRGAARAYRRHLDANPGDQPIWVQLGHAWKEQGLLTQAAEAYGTAVDLDPQDGDAGIHLADLLRRMGRKEDALTAYEQANKAEPSVEAMQQIRLLRRFEKSGPAIELHGDTTFFAIQDFFGYLKAHVTMSGIQRVQAGIALNAIQDSDLDVRFILSNTGSATSKLRNGEFWMVDNAQMKRVIDYASGEYVDHDMLREMLADCEDAAQRVRPVSGNSIILLGAFWGLGNGVRHFVDSKRNGVRIGAYVYDIIPVTHPEFCDDALVVDFSMAICELCAVADFIFTISDATRITLAEFIAGNGGRPIPMATVPLAHHLTRDAGQPDIWPAQLARVRGRRYVAYVSTIEARKNHLYVVNAWRRLIAQGVDVPDLVFVGRMGWKIDALTDVLAATDNLDGRLHVAHNLSDGELNAVYAGCDFSVFTSFVEGWGLPIGESLIHGRPCVASDTSSMPEVGGDLVDYVDPFNLDQGVAVLRRMITDRAYLRSREEAIRDRFVPRTWRDVGQDFLQKTKAAQDTPVAPLDIGLDEGALCPFASDTPDRGGIDDYFHRLDRLVGQSSSFYPMERDGTWLEGAAPEITVATRMPPGTEVLVYLDIWVGPGAGDCRLRIFDHGSRRESAAIGLAALDDGRPVRIHARVDDAGMLHLRFGVIGRYSTPNDDRDFAIGLKSLGYAGIDNVPARQELIEAMTLHSLAS